MFSRSAFLWLLLLTLNVKAMDLILNCNGNGEASTGSTVKIVNVETRNRVSSNAYKGQLSHALDYWVEIKFHIEGEPTLEHEWSIFEGLEAIVSTDIAAETPGEKAGILRAYYIGRVAEGSFLPHYAGKVALVTELPGMDLYDYSMNNTMSAKEWLRISYLLFRTMKYMHDHDVLHGNINPAAFAFVNNETKDKNGRTTQLYVTDMRFAKFQSSGAPELGPSGSLAFMSLLEHQLLEAKVARLNGGNTPPVIVERRRSDVEAGAISIYFIWFRTVPWLESTRAFYADVNRTAPVTSTGSRATEERKLYDTLQIANNTNPAILTLPCLDDIKALKAKFMSTISANLRKGSRLTQPGVILKQMVAFAQTKFYPANKPYSLVEAEEIWLGYWNKAYQNLCNKNDKIPPIQDFDNKQKDSSNPPPLNRISGLPVDDETPEEIHSEQNPELSQSAGSTQNQEIPATLNIEPKKETSVGNDKGVLNNSFFKKKLRESCC